MSEEEKKETFREAKILEVLNHPNIIRFKEVYKTKKGQLCIVMDFADGKNICFSNFRWGSGIGDQETAGKGRLLF
jgi:serine/threonine protein kinase